MTDSVRTQTKSTAAERLTRYLWLLWILWLSFLIYPLHALFQAHPSSLRLVVVLAAAALFAAVYAWNVWRNLRRVTSGQQPSSPWLAIAVLVAFALALTLGDRRDWVELFIFVSASMGPSLPTREAVRAVGALLLLMVVLGWAIGGGIGQTAQIVLQAAVTGSAVIIVVRTIVLDCELRQAREEIARLAVSEERLRFARDLHDLLGHSLSLIALKSELAGRLAAASPERAAAEIRDVEGVARTALQEVREAVAGYRQARLGDELQNAQEILEAAGVAYQCQGDVPSLPAAQEAALSWAVREGVTNVIKHGRADACTVRVTHDAAGVAVEITDDGRGSDGPPTAVGSGLAGLSERVTALGGRCEAGPRPGGGFRLAVVLPLKDAKAGSRGDDAVRTA